MALFGQSSFGGGGATTAFGGVSLGAGQQQQQAVNTAGAANPMKDLEVRIRIVHVYDRTRRAARTEKREKKRFPWI